MGVSCNSKKLKGGRHVASDPLAALEVESVVEPSPQEEPILRRSTRLRNVCEVMLLDISESSTYSEVMVGPESESCLRAMKSELKSIDENQICNLVDLPNGARPIEGKRVFKKKTARWKCIRLQGLAHCKGVLYVSDNFRESTTRDFLTGSNA